MRQNMYYMIKLYCDNMKIEIIKVGRLECNCYLLDINNRVLVIDPGDDGDKIIDQIGDRCVVGIVVTHYHFDHIGALDELVSRYGCMIYNRNNMLEGENRIDEFIFDVIYTPGHKEDALTIYFEDEKIMFCGDFIFRDSIGRCDLPGGNMDEMIDSIEKIKKYNREIIIYSGHGEKTNLGYEIDNNIYFRGKR